MRVAKSLFTAILIVSFSVISLSGTLFFNDKASLRKFLIKITSLFSNLLLIVLDITAVTLHSPLWQKQKPYLIVSNHLSYIDVLVIASVMPSVFVSSMEVRTSLFLGFLARCGGTLFIERRKKSDLKREIKMLADALKQGSNVVVFPEGTSSKGEIVFPFKKSLFEAALQSKSNVLPVCLKYHDERKKQSGSVNNPVCWYGDMAFFPHFINLFKQTGIHATMHIMEPLNICEYASRNELAEDAYCAITEAYNWKISDTAKSNPATPRIKLSFEH